MDEKAEKGSAIELHAHGDGTYHTIARGSGDYYPSMGGKDPRRKEHESFGAAVVHMAKHHAEGDHMHIMGHEDGFTSHHMKEGGNPSGPVEHDNVTELKKHVAKVMNSDDEEMD